MKTFFQFVFALLAGMAGAYLMNRYQQEKMQREQQNTVQTVNQLSNSVYQPTVVNAAPPATIEKVDFSEAAAKAIPSVVFINSISQGVTYTYWDWFFGNGSPQTQVSSGSGVIFSADGYIVTNNHVIQTAEKIQVIYNKKTYPAELVGTDPSTDLAVLKIKESGLPAITIGSSKNVAVGEWVIAVGNPFSLSSTVTAGIVSAKGRRINIVEDRFPIESFIQTDAAINPGNSGGALVNKNGELVGINTAILSRTGSYTGYAFAVPVDIARKVVEDIIKYDGPQKAIIGATILEYDSENAGKFGLDANAKNFNGVLVGKVDVEGAARASGLKQGDVITKVNDIVVNTQSAFEEEIAYRSPGDKVMITYSRDGKSNQAELTLLNKNGGTTIIRRKIYSDGALGASFEAVDYGVKVFRIKENGLIRELGLPENVVITVINRKRVKDPQDVIDFLNSYKGRGYLEAVTSSRERFIKEFMLR
jgi:S1-C subfamily serine protease